MFRKSILLTALAVLLSAAPAFSQEKRFEAGAFFGWTFSDGVDGDGILAQDGNLYNRLDPKDSIKWGLNFGYLATEQAEVGFQFSQQNSKLTAGGTNTKEVGDMSVLNYHGYVTYNFGEADTKVRPYVLIGAGATHFSSVPIPGSAGSLLCPPGAGCQTQGNTKFSTTWGTGVKFFTSPKFGIKVGAQWTPTYIKSDSDGYWCDPWFGCYVVGNAQYSNQLDILGGVVFKF
jgi:outer membrane protein W